MALITSGGANGKITWWEKNVARRQFDGHQDESGAGLPIRVMKLRQNGNTLVTAGVRRPAICHESFNCVTLFMGSRRLIADRGSFAGGRLGSDVDGVGGGRALGLHHRQRPSVLDRAVGKSSALLNRGTKHLAQASSRTKEMVNPVSIHLHAISLVGGPGPSTHTRAPAAPPAGGAPLTQPPVGVAAAKTPPLPCVPTAFAAKTPPLPCVFHCVRD